MTHVVDTSVLLKWVVAEEDSAVALQWVGRPLVAPDLYRLELANAFWKKILRGEMTEAQASRGLGEVDDGLVAFPSGPLVERALSLAVELGHPVYDCVFLALAQSLSVQLLTADRRLWRACAGTRLGAVIQPLQEGM